MTQQQAICILVHTICIVLPVYIWGKVRAGGRVKNWGFAVVPAPLGLSIRVIQSITDWVQNSRAPGADYIQTLCCNLEGNLCQVVIRALAPP